MMIQPLAKSRICTGSALRRSVGFRNSKPLSPQIIPLCREIWDSMDTSWQVPYDEGGSLFRNAPHGTHIVLHLTNDYHYTRERSEQLRAALCTVCSPFADIENGLPSTLPPLFQGGKPREKQLDKTLGDKFRSYKKQPIEVTFNMTRLFAEPDARMANLEVALSTVRMRSVFLHRFVATPTFSFWNRSKSSCFRSNSFQLH